MIEIFTLGSGQTAGPSRSFSNEIKLSAPSDVYFGSAAAGIAFYEKSGADLRVTLLDGTEVLIRDFFVIGPQGEYSRLFDGGAAGSIEVTGLIAPEPYLPPEAQPDPAPPSDGALTASAPAETAEEDSPAEPITVSAPAEGGGGGAFAGMPLDRLLFGAAMLPSLGALLKKDDEEEAAPEVARFAAQAPLDAENAEVDDQAPSDSDSDPDIDPELAALIAPSLDDALAVLFGTDKQGGSSRAFGPEGHDEEFDLAGFSNFLDGFPPFTTEG
ncbi:hypothetical protein Q9295_03150 [Xinfangfangia sp. CPCC 101601]|uniref:Biofilm-associated protein BapA-like prefix-like domain-containing protein n=1 Tax=Pseudogemmobacter lacusdianii TaxID=3069608 RepID=A0ABU0VUF5_9RHOB|nr:hypothetical protein [Xinfangfangia sp. CPCC 101601]MDQ2065359.1 hypothetical protein [Xinfangfangia sp. CPCC 101601]